MLDINFFNRNDSTLLNSFYNTFDNAVGFMSDSILRTIIPPSPV